MNPTPAPWTTKGIGKDIVVESAKGEQVAYINSFASMSESARAANARLIAAAPSLLEALKRARIYLSACKKETFPPGLMDAVESAIEKATGGEQ